MVAFASPPREPNQWFEMSVVTPAVTIATERTPRWRRALARTGAVVLCAAAIVMLTQPRRLTAADYADFAQSGMAGQAEQFLTRRLGSTPRLSAVHSLMRNAQLYCRPTAGVAHDSLLVCLGTPIRRSQTYTRMAFRFVARGDSVTQIRACPALIMRRTNAAPAELLARAVPSITDLGCWRDPDNILHAEWTYADLPARGAFTTVSLPDAPRMQIESAPSRDTIFVWW
jgi:hypothetical protein